MEKASISQLKNNLSAYIKKVRAGASVLILDRDHPVARLERVQPGELADAHLAELERQGLIRRPSGSLAPELWEEEPPDAGVSLLDTLLEERREER